MICIVSVVGKCIHYWSSGTEEVHVEETNMSLRQSTLKRLKMWWVHEALSEVMRPLFGSRSTVC